MALIGLAAIAVAFSPVLDTLLTLWRGGKYHPYLGLVPPLFALMLWMSRDRRRTIAGHGTVLGAAVIVAALVLLGLGRTVSSVPLQSLSLVVAAVGIAVWLRGIEWTRTAAYPFAFLLFLVPVPRSVFDGLTLDVQRLLTRYAGAVLDSAGIPVMTEEFAIHLPTVTLEIVEACNGLRFLSVFVVITAAAAGLLVASVAGRIILIALAIPAAVAANVVRIASIGLVGHWFGPDAATGQPHYLVGWVLWAILITVMVAVACVLRRLSEPCPPVAEHVPMPCR